MSGGWKLTGQKVKVAEKDVVKAVKQLLGWHHYLPIRIHCGGCTMPDGTWTTLAPEGTPDFVVLDPIRPAFFWEAKAPRGRLSPAQIRRQEELRIAQFQVVTVHSVEEMERWLEEHERSP